MHIMDKVWDPLRRKEVALTPEEGVRQWFISVLRDELEVPEHLMGSEVAMEFGGKKWRADIVVYRRDLTPAVIVECKKPEVKLTGRVLDQALRYHSLLDAEWLIVTNGNDTRAFRRLDGHFGPALNLPKYSEL